jgi:hypothetical protein
MIQIISIISPLISIGVLWIIYDLKKRVKKLEDGPEANSNSK